jgi:hypothetical protein
MLIYFLVPTDHHYYREIASSRSFLSQCKELSTYPMRRSHRDIPRNVDDDMVPESKRRRNAMQKYQDIQYVVVSRKDPPFLHRCSRLIKQPAAVQRQIDWLGHSWTSLY